MLEIRNNVGIHHDSLCTGNKAYNDTVELLFKGILSTGSQVLHRSHGHQKTGAECGLYAVVYIALRGQGCSEEDVGNKNISPNVMNDNVRETINESLRRVYQKWTPVLHTKDKHTKDKHKGINHIIILDE